MGIQNQTRSLLEKKINPKSIITNIYREPGYSAVRSFSDFPRNHEQISNIGYSEKPLSKLVNIL